LDFKFKEDEIWNLPSILGTALATTKLKSLDSVSLEYVQKLQFIIRDGLTIELQQQ